MTEYEIETKETMEREQKVIVLRTKEYCTHCVTNKEEGGVSATIVSGLWSETSVRVRVKGHCEMQEKGAP